MQEESLSCGQLVLQTKALRQHWTQCEGGDQLGYSLMVSLFPSKFLKTQDHTGDQGHIVWKLAKSWVRGSGLEAGSSPGLPWELLRNAGSCTAFPHGDRLRKNLPISKVPGGMEGLG